MAAELLGLKGFQSLGLEFGRGEFRVQVGDLILQPLGQGLNCGS